MAGGGRRRGRKPKGALAGGRSLPGVPLPALPGVVAEALDPRLTDSAVAGRARALGRAVRVRLFVRQFVAGGPGVAGHAGAAAWAAGLATTRRGASAVGSDLLRDPGVVRVIERQLESLRATTDRVVEELGRVAFSDAREIDEARRRVEAGEPLDDLPDHVASAIAEVSRSTTAEGGLSVRVRAHEKVAALHLLAKIRRLVVPATQRVEVVGEGGGPVRHEVAAVHVYLPQNGRDALPADASVIGVVSGDPAVGSARRGPQSLPSAGPRSPAARLTDGGRVEGADAPGDDAPGSTPGASTIPDWSDDDEALEH